MPVGLALRAHELESLTSLLDEPELDAHESSGPPPDCEPEQGPVPDAHEIAHRYRVIDGALSRIGSSEIVIGEGLSLNRLLELRVALAAPPRR